MIQDECLDIRTITMGISLLDCCSEDMNRVCDRVYDKITRKAERLVAVGQQIETEYGIPIINKRISITPAAMLVSAPERISEAFAYEYGPMTRASFKSGTTRPIMSYT